MRACERAACVRALPVVGPPAKLTRRESGADGPLPGFEFAARKKSNAEAPSGSATCVSECVSARVCASARALCARCVRVRTGVAASSSGMSRSACIRASSDAAKQARLRPTPSGRKRANQLVQRCNAFFNALQRVRARYIALQRVITGSSRFARARLCVCGVCACVCSCVCSCV